MFNKIRNLRKIRNHKGFSLVEILIVVGFIAAAGIGIYVIYDKVQSGNAANAEVRNIDVLRAEIRNIYASSSTYNGVAPKVLLDARSVPDNMRSGDTIINSFGGVVKISATGFNGGTNNAFNIEYPAIPIDVCSRLVTLSAPVFNKVQVNGQVVKDSSKGSNDLDVSLSAAACGASGASGATLVLTSL